MKRVISSLLLMVMVFTATTFTSCLENEDGGNGTIIYYSDIVSCHLDADGFVTFEQILNNDQGSITLDPETPFTNKNISENQRVMLQYIAKGIVEDNHLSINIVELAAVRNDTITQATADILAEYPNEQVILKTLWRTGPFLNLEVQLEYFNKQHRLDLFTNPMQASSDTLDVVLRHDRQGDAPGYWTTAFASFYVPEMLNTDFKVLRMYANIPSEPQGYVTTKLRDK